MPEYAISYIDNESPTQEIELSDLGTYKRPNKHKVAEFNKVMKLLGYKGKFKNVSVMQELPTHWETRAQQKFVSGEWLEPIWDKTDLYDWKYFKTGTTYAIHCPHFVKGSNPNEGIFFYPTDRARRFDQVECMKPGRYVKTFVNQFFSAVDIREYTDLLIPREIFLAWSPEEIEEVYLNGPSSCMGGNIEGRKQSWRTRAYGAGDFAVAYLKNSSGRICVRGLCVPTQKAMIAFYGSTHYQLKAALAIQGYTYKSKIHDVRLLKVVNQFNDLHLPYFDFAYDKMINNDERTLKLVDCKHRSPPLRYTYLGDDTHHIIAYRGRC